MENVWFFRFSLIYWESAFRWNQSKTFDFYCFLRRVFWKLPKFHLHKINVPLRLTTSNGELTITKSQGLPPPPQPSTNSASSKSAHSHSHHHQSHRILSHHKNHHSHHQSSSTVTTPPAAETTDDESPSKCGFRLIFDCSIEWMYAHHSAHVIKSPSLNEDHRHICWTLSIQSRIQNNCAPWNWSTFDMEISFHKSKIEIFVSIKNEWRRIWLEIS